MIVNKDNGSINYRKDFLEYTIIKMIHQSKNFFGEISHSPYEHTLEDQYGSRKRKEFFFVGVWSILCCDLLSCSNVHWIDWEFRWFSFFRTSRTNLHPLETNLSSSASNIFTPTNSDPIPQRKTLTLPTRAKWSEFFRSIYTSMRVPLFVCV